MLILVYHLKKEWYFWIANISRGILLSWLNFKRYRNVTTAIIPYYLFEIEVGFHGHVYLVSEDIGVGWMKILRDPCSSF